ncbi:MAG: hypothetical protein K1X53_08395 [Candidatus Sumerlaeaceae bacterium]|nr:hypothetical protein [Candidatus Sumerlaeaceae bacterium]
MGSFWGRLGFVVGLCGVCAVSAAASFSVNTLTDEDDGVTVGQVSLRDAINAANDTTETDTITFSTTGTFVVTTVLPAVTSTMTIIGVSPASTVVSGGGSQRLLFVDGGGLTVSDLTLHGGYARGGHGATAGSSTSGGGGGGAAGLGAGILLSRGSLTATNVTFTSHTVQGGNGGSGLSAATSSCGGSVGGDATNFGPAPGTPFSTLRNGNDGVGGTSSGGVFTAPGNPGGFGAGGGGAGFALNLSGSSGGAGGFGGGGGGGSANSGGGGFSTGGFGGNGGGLKNDTGCGGGGGAGLGAALFARTGTSTLLTNCTFSNNRSYYGAGGGPGSISQTPQTGSGRGAAIFAMSGAVATVSDLVFSANDSANATGSGYTVNVLSDTDDVYGILSGQPVAGVQDWEVY